MEQDKRTAEGTTPSGTEPVEPSGYSVGHCKPPLHTRFEKGVSGNPGGRPRGSRNLRTDFLEELNETIPVTEGGKQRQLSKQQITVKTLVTLGMKGNLQALGKVIDLALKLAPQEEPNTPEGILSEADHEILAAFLARHSGAA